VPSPIGSGSDNVPSDTLIVSSHALATENQIELVSSEMAAIVGALKRLPPVGYANGFDKPPQKTLGID
jgi:hypothetical protein